MDSNTVVAIVTAIFASGGLWSVILTAINNKAKRKEDSKASSCKKGEGHHGKEMAKGGRHQSA